MGSVSTRSMLTHTITTVKIHLLTSIRTLDMIVFELLRSNRSVRIGRRRYAQVRRTGRGGDTVANRTVNFRNAAKSLRILRAVC